jgi:drug/metabolite transporter (DMT)-like permease
MLIGVVLTAGLLDHHITPHSTAGTVHAALAALCYAGFLYLLRRCGHSGHITESYTVLTVSAAAVSLGAGVFWHGITLTPGWTATAWLLVTALTGQVIGWLLVAFSAPRLPSHLGPVLLLFTPIGALILGAAVLGERPTPPQLLGGGLILAGAYFANSSSSDRSKPRTAEPDVQG